MTYHDSAYVEKLTAFSALLRQEGITAGPQETTDACIILSDLDLSQRSIVRDALCAVYAKSREQQLAFYRAFDSFFVSVEQREAIKRKQKAEAEDLSRLREDAKNDFQVNGQPLDIREDLQEVYIHMPEEKREELRQLTEKTKMNIDRSPKLYTNFIRSVFMRFLLEQQMLMEDAAVGCDESDPDMGLLYRDISHFKDTDIPRATALIATIAKQLNAELSQKRRRGGHSGKLDFKRTIRKGLETGGVFYRLSYRHKRKKRRQLVMLCDVSGSMLQFSEFVLRFLKSMSEVSDSIRIFLFSEELREVDPFSLQNMDAFRKYVRSSGLYGRGTDLGTALDALCQLQNSPLTQGTTLLILSDTKTIDLPRAARTLIEAQRKTGKILWLNPIPENKWQYISSIQTMSSLCQMMSCSTLDELARACRRLLKN
ncbi:MAG: VWA domain-containing protein [Oscillospiraceae bacterium]|nr:VWA domain-containing protein [Oscillospiraceae bacterium]